MFEASNSSDCVSMLLRFKAPNHIGTLIESAISLRGKFYSNKVLHEPYKVNQTITQNPEASEQEAPKKPITNWITNSLSFFTSGIKSQAEEGKGTRFVIDEEGSATPLDKIEGSLSLLKQEYKSNKSENIAKAIKLLQEAFNELK